MAIASVPFWLSEANTEFSSDGNASSILNAAGIPAPRWLSELVGKSNVETITLPAGLQTSITVTNYITSLTAGKVYHIIVPPTARYVAPSASVYALYCNIPQAGAGTILEIQAGARIWGHGGDGGHSSSSPGRNGTNGGPALQISSNITLLNNGQVLGGGGGGGASPGGNYGGSGGQPNGGAGRGDTHAGNPGTLDAPGAAVGASGNSGGAGGAVGHAGGAGVGSGTHGIGGGAGRAIVTV